MPRLLPLLAALLVLSACDADGVDIVAGSAITVEAPATVRANGDAEITARFTNTTGRDLWLGRPEIQLFFQPEPPADFSTTSEPVLVYSPIITMDLRPNVRIRPGETRDVFLFLDLQRGDQEFADGDYRLGLMLFTNSGNKDPLLRGKLAPTAVRFSKTFPLTFR